MKVLVVGGGGREHALAWKISQSPLVEKIFVAPGNAGTAQEKKTENSAIAPTDIVALISFAKTNNIDLTIVGPEAPLAAGITDAFKQHGIACYGPSMAAAYIETSKAYAKNFMSRHKIPTAAYTVCTDIASAHAYIEEQEFPLVIKADGLTGGKGVRITHTKEEAVHVAHQMLSGNLFGQAGKKIVIEEYLSGEEASFIVMSDGSHALPLASSQDHKWRDNKDTGPITGGMGAYSPAPVITPELHQKIMDQIITPTINGMAEEENRYVGFLYAGLIITANGEPKVLEFNCRLGDPETQPLMMRLKTDLVSLCNAALEKRLHEVSAVWDPRAAVGIVLTAGGYPEQYHKGDVITGLDTINNAECKVFHASTASQNDMVVTAGGRVLCVTALGNSVAQAQEKAYEAAQKINWREMYYRTDIGWRAIEK